MNRIHVFVSLAFFLFHLESFAQISVSNWNLGSRILCPPDSIFEVRPHIPVRFSLYSDDNKVADVIELSGHIYNALSINKTLSLSTFEVDQCDFDPTSRSYIAVFGETPMSVKVGSHGKYAWLRKADVESAGYTIMRWIDLLVSTREHYDDLFPICEGSGLNLRKGPGTSYPIVKTLPPFTTRGPVFSIKPTGKLAEGSWLEVVVHQFREFDCVRITENKLAEYFGWIKAVDDKTGLPNVFFYDDCRTEYRSCKDCCK